MTTKADSWSSHLRTKRKVIRLNPRRRSRLWSIPKSKAAARRAANNKTDGTGVCRKDRNLKKYVHLSDMNRTRKRATFNLGWISSVFFVCLRAENRLFFPMRCVAYPNASIHVNFSESMKIAAVEHSSHTDWRRSISEIFVPQRMYRKGRRICTFYGRIATIC